MILTRKDLEIHSFTPDFTNKRVYWVESDFKNFEFILERSQKNNYHIFSSDYDFQDKKAITSGTYIYPIPNLLAVSGDSLYFLNNNMNQINVSNENIIRSIPLNMDGYYNLIVVTSSLQPSCK
jgi:hypothetical protein